MFHNDPVLVALMERWGLSPLAVFYWSLVLVPGVLLSWSALTKTLVLKPTRENPNGHGLCSPINAYLILVPILNYCIFDYYFTYEREIKGLFASGVLPGSFGDFVNVLSNPWVTGISIFGYAAGLVIAILSITSHWKWRRSKLTNWLCQRGHPRAISWYFNISFFCFELAIVFNWFLRHMLIWRTLNDYIISSKAIPLHPDGMFGLGPLSTLAVHSLVVITITTLLGSIWLVGGRLTLRRESLFRNPGHVATITVLVLLGPVVVITPLTSAHRRLEAEREAAQRYQAALVVLAANAIQSLSSDDPHADQKIKIFETQQRIYQQIESSRTWPLSTSASGSLPFAFLNPLLLPLAVEAGKRILNRRWIKATSAANS
jgi:hypothetical protein